MNPNATQNKAQGSTLLFLEVRVPQMILAQMAAKKRTKRDERIHDQGSTIASAGSVLSRYLVGLTPSLSFSLVDPARGAKPILFLLSS